MKNKAILFFSVFYMSVSLVAFSAESNDSNANKKEIVLDQYNLRIAIPPTWFSISYQDPHFIASVAESESPTIKDTRYGAYLATLSEKVNLNELMNRTAQGKANRVRQRNLIKLGKQEAVEVAGLKGREDMFIFTVEGRAYTYAVVGFEKGGIGYVLDFWAPRGIRSKMVFDRFRNWLKNGIEFLDPSKDINENLKLQIKKADESASQKYVFSGSDKKGRQSIRNIADFQKADYGNQKTFMEEQLPETTEIERLSKQAMLAEHAGKFTEAKRYYEQLLEKKNDVIAIQGEIAWVMLHPAVQRTSELTGDKAREKEMLIWIRDNMISEQGAYHKYLNGLLPQVQSHLKERINEI